MKVPKASDGKNRAMEVSCWAKEPREDELLGKGTVDITETLKTGEFDGALADLTQSDIRSFSACQTGYNSRTMARSEDLSISR